jgi:hypothetical protein
MNVMLIIGILLLVALGVVLLRFGFGILLAVIGFLLRNIFWVIVLIFILIMIF